MNQDEIALTKKRDLFFSYRTIVVAVILIYHTDEILDDVFAQRTHLTKRRVFFKRSQRIESQSTSSGADVGVNLIIFPRQALRTVNGTDIFSPSLNLLILV